MNALAMPPGLAAEATLLDRALAALRERTGLQATLATRQVAEGGAPADALVAIVGAAGERRYRAFVITRPPKPADLARVVMTSWPDDPALLVAPHINAAQAERCRANNLEFIDAAGNAFLRGAGLFVQIVGNKPDDEATSLLAGKRANGGAGNAAALRVVFGLLVRPALLDATYRDIAAAAGVALGGVGAVLDDLTRRGHLRTVDGRRRLIEPRRLFTEWENHWPTRLHPRLKARRFTAGKPDWWRDLDPLAHGAQWGGDVAAWHYTQALKPATVTLHLAPDDLDAGLRGLARAGQLRAAADGEVEILQRFWDLDRVPDGPLAPAPLVHAQLIATLDPRALAVAAQLFDSHLADALAQA
ncbi:type IV toxin-antitoxin system AbiEi family antitoxin [Derxia gummosa]|uniref:Type IV toxin-antitoxin system AbiEi family antitoxin n=1 Tax=Derxia gummosa DSM 723 TaxID=1121388 RepID=A0A8B6X9W0_9BURK|nr:type IV toxin-antitoxin system AbiEi family antitoxin [Derxia gummosa]